MCWLPFVTYLWYIYQERSLQRLYPFLNKQNEAMETGVHKEALKKKDEDTLE